MKKLLLAAAAPLLITSHGFGVAKATITIEDTKTETAQNGGNGSLLQAQLAPNGGRRKQPINGQCGSANGVPVSSAPSSNLCSQGRATRVIGRRPWHPSGNPVIMWQIGAYQAHQAIDGNWSWVPDTYQTQLRQGNWDWVTGSQTWLGIGGTQSMPNGTPVAIPNSLYLSAAPAFFGASPWPWVDPSTGTTYVLPAKARFDAGTANNL